MDCEELISRTIQKDVLYEELLRLRSKMNHAYQIFKNLEERFERKKLEYCKLDHGLALEDGRRTILKTRETAPLPRQRTTKEEKMKSAIDAFKGMTKEDREILLLEITQTDDPEA